jgi:hypothetical protein
MGGEKGRCKKISLQVGKNQRTRKNILPKKWGFFAYHFLKAHLHHSSQIKSCKEVKKQQKQSLFLLLLLDD